MGTMAEDHEHQVDAASTVAEPEYSGFGHFLLAIGITAEPTVIRYRCKLCGKVFAQTRDPEARRKATF